jgi:prepilin-type N-terminal cleavage/methylation domain-containing protein
MSKKAFSLIELSIVILIIGILVAGVTQGSRLVSQFRLSNARSLTLGSPVNSIKDLSIWLETTSEKSFDTADQEDGLAVDNWYDTNPQISRKINFNQAITTRQPTFKASGINGIPTIYFDGGSGVNMEYLENSSYSFADIASSNQITIFIVQNVEVKASATTDNNSTIMFSSTSSDAIERINFHSPSANGLYFDFGTSGAGARVSYTPLPSNFFSKTHISTLIRKTNNTGIIRFDGAEIVNAAQTGVFSSTEFSNQTFFYIGAIPFDTPYAFKGHIGEIIIFQRALKSDEIDDVENYLAKKWNIDI